MPREISIEMPFAMGAAAFWALRMDRNFDVFCTPPQVERHGLATPAL